ncbi:DUF3293 domain-containing protein [Wenzhouxiangella sp. C33]|uniref:DUF3293 domain-containing protein n=1 Tax=Wenzhouxiangella limi TaxID=2707351 RepID=A0A845V4G1_9GAMM|nr:DUF3293 domain-containing protein [Wenzhouxiangella limi]
MSCSRAGCSKNSSANGRRAVDGAIGSLSRLDGALIAAYRAALYRIADRFDLKIDQASPELAAWQLAHKVDCSALLTACNPAGQRVDERVNQSATAALAARIRRAHWPHSPTLGLDPAGRWPAEPGFLVGGLALAPARELGRLFDQNAIVWAGSDAVPRLILLR